MKNLPKAIFISGTDTSVGKTVVTAFLAWCLKKTGRKVGVIKPFQTGTESEPFLDVEFVYNFLGEDYDFDRVCPSRLKEPLSPYSAAKIENIKIQLNKIIDHTKDYISEHDITLVEGAGGLYVPITEDYLIADLVGDIDSSLLLVTRPGLGTINHTLLSVDYIKQKKLSFLGLVINGLVNDPDLASITNLDVFHNLYKINIVGILPHFGKIGLDDEKIQVIKSGIGNYFSPVFGGTFDYENFVKNL